MYDMISCEWFIKVVVENLYHMKNDLWEMIIYVHKSFTFDAKKNKTQYIAFLFLEFSQRAIAECFFSST